MQYPQHLRARGDGDAAHLLSENDDVVRMMTIHKSKGLEFPVVFLPGMEDGLFPGSKAFDRPEGMEED